MQIPHKPGLGMAEWCLNGIFKKRELENLTRNSKNIIPTHVVIADFGNLSQFLCEAGGLAPAEHDPRYRHFDRAFIILHALD